MTSEIKDMREFYDEGFADGSAGRPQRTEWVYADDWWRPGTGPPPVPPEPPPPGGGFACCELAHNIVWQSCADPGAALDPAIPAGSRVYSTDQGG